MYSSLLIVLLAMLELSQSLSDRKLHLCWDEVPILTRLLSLLLIRHHKVLIMVLNMSWEEQLLISNRQDWIQYFLTHQCTSNTHKLHLKFLTHHKMQAVAPCWPGWSYFPFSVQFLDVLKRIQIFQPPSLKLWWKCLIPFCFQVPQFLKQDIESQDDMSYSSRGSNIKDISVKVVVRQFCCVNTCWLCI
jgi:hypothetical protein